MAFLSLLPQQIESSLKNLHPKCNHSQLQAWSCKNCCSCFKVNYFKAFEIQKLYVMLRVEQCEPCMIAEPISLLPTRFSIQSHIFLGPPRSQVLSALPISTFLWWRDKAALFPATASPSLCLCLDLPSVKTSNEAPSIPSEPAGLRLLWTQSQNTRLKGIARTI